MVGEDLLKARLEPDLLQEIDLIKDHVNFHKQQVRINTKALYTQQKYNLFREESEGYSKLITELVRRCDATSPPTRSPTPKAASRTASRARERARGCPARCGCLPLPRSRLAGRLGAAKRRRAVACC